MKWIRRYWKVINFIILKLYHVDFKNDFCIYGKIKIKNSKLCIRKIEYPRIHIGSMFGMNSHIRYNLIGGDSGSVLRTIDNGEIVIKDNVSMSNVTIVAKEKVIIENYVMLGGGVKIYDTDFHPLPAELRKENDLETICSKTVTIKENAFIGAHSIILKGVTIGENSIIGAGSVVSKSIPANEIWAGNPVRFIRKL